jgi:hypothetical protein
MQKWHRVLRCITLATIACSAVFGCSQLKPNAPSHVPKSPHDVVRDDLRDMVKDQSPLGAEATLSQNGYTVRRYSDGAHEIILATQIRQIPSASSAIQEVKVAITFESGVFTDLVVEEAFLQRPERNDAEEP